MFKENNPRNEDRLPRKLAAILYADVVGYSRLTGEDEDYTHHRLTEYLDVIANTVKQNNGRVMHYAGDAALAMFGAVVDAVSCARSIQTDLELRNQGLPTERKVQFRIGVNLGDVIEDRGDIYGEGVNVAARLEGIAEPGGICISASVRTAIGNKFSINYEDLGEQALKNIESPIRAYRILCKDEHSETDETPLTDSSPFEFKQEPQPSIGILPFKNLSGDPSNDYVPDGLRLCILSSLVQLSGLFLVGNSAVNGFRGQEVSADQVAHEVGFRYALEGSVQMVEKHVRATFQLTDSHTNTIVWAERYDRNFDDLFTLQDEITQEVIIALDVQLLGREADRIWFNKLSGSKAHELFLRGISYLYRFTKNDNTESRSLFEELYRVQPEVVSGPSLVALTYWLEAFHGWTDSPAQSMEKAARWAKIAVDYEDNNGLGHTVLGHLLLLEGKHEEALENSRIAAGLRASCPLANGIYASVQNYCGDSHGAVNSARKALELEGTNPPWMINVLAAAYRDEGKVNLSTPAAEESIRLDPKQTEARVILCSNYALANAHDKASQVAKDIVTTDPSFSLSAYLRSQPYKDRARLDNLAEALLKAGLPE